MNNPFEVIEARLSIIENLLLDLKHNPQAVEPTDPEKLLTIQEAAEFLSLFDWGITGKNPLKSPQKYLSIFGA